jgi:hypothetical protein
MEGRRVHKEMVIAYGELEQKINSFLSKDTCKFAQSILTTFVILFNNV